MNRRTTELGAALRWLTLTMLGTWTTGYLGVCPLSGKHMWLTTAAAMRAAAREAIDLVAGGMDADAAAALAAGHHTGTTDAAHAPLAESRGGTRIVLTDAATQQALSDEDTLGTDDALSIDTTKPPRGVSRMKREVSEARKRLR